MKRIMMLLLSDWATPSKGPVSNFPYVLLALLLWLLLTWCGEAGDEWPNWSTPAAPLFFNCLHSRDGDKAEHPSSCSPRSSPLLFLYFFSSFSRFFLLCFFRPFFGHWSSLPPYFLPFVLCVSWVFLPPPCSSVVLDIYGARLALRLGCVLLKMHFAAVWLIEKLIYCLLGPT